MNQSINQSINQLVSQAYALPALAPILSLSNFETVDFESLCESIGHRQRLVPSRRYATGCNGVER